MSIAGFIESIAVAGSNYFAAVAGMALASENGRGQKKIFGK